MPLPADPAFQGPRHLCATSEVRQQPLRHHESSKKMRACQPCHARKVRCDASLRGLPCTRCISNTREGECVYISKGYTKQARKAQKASRVALHNLVPTPESPGQPRPQMRERLQQSEIHRSPLTPNFDGFAVVELQQQPTAPRSSRQDNSINSFPHYENDIALERLPGQTQTYSQSESDSPSESQSVAEEDVHMHICQEITGGKIVSPSMSGVSAPSPKIFEYQNKMAATTILDELLSRDKARRLIAVAIAKPRTTDRTFTVEKQFQRTRDLELSGLSEPEKAFLTAEGAFDFPPHIVCEEFLQLYFKSVYPYAPILDRLQLLSCFESGQQSSFLFQSLLTNVLPYASIELLRRAGFNDHLTAQRISFKRATLLNDFGCEKSLLLRLQGFLLLGTQWVSVAGDKDHRYWLSNAVRVATRMGLHKEHISEDLDPTSHKLFRRIWWVVYARDVLCSISGLDNMRYVNADYCDTKPVTEEDWKEPDSVVSERLQKEIPETTRLQKLYFIETCKLAMIGERFHKVVLSLGNGKLSDETRDELVEAFPRWRERLPIDLRLVGVQWTNDSVWILVLMSWCYRLECMVYRSLQQHYKQLGSPSYDWAVKRMYGAMFELDTIIRRATMHQVAPKLPMSFSTSVTTVIALHIGVAIDTNLSKNQRLMSEISIRSGLAYLQEAQDNWTCLRQTLRLFEWVFSKTGLKYDIEISKGGYLHSHPPPQSQNLMGATTHDINTSPDASNMDLSVDPFLNYELWDLDQNLFGEDFPLDIQSFVNVGMP